MYVNNAFSKRRSDGWAERRRHFRRLFEQTRESKIKPAKDPKDETQKSK